MAETKLKQLIESGKASIIYVHGTARSGSTIAEIIFSQLCDCAIHQPWRGILQERGGRFRPDKLEFDADIYQAGCEFITQQIHQILEQQAHATVIVKELAGFFKPSIWQSWIEIPDKFIFTIRDPHLQYLSWLSSMTDKILQGQGRFQENHKFVLSKAEIIEQENLPAEWEGTTIGCNLNSWKALLDDYLYLHQYLKKSDKTLAIIEGLLLRKDPDSVIDQTLEQLGLRNTTDQCSSRNLYQHSQQKVRDIRDAQRPMVTKARNSNDITPLSVDHELNFNLLPLKSQQHLQQIIPIYLDLLYAPENTSIPIPSELLQPVNGSEHLTLKDINPFLAYTIAKYHQSQTASTIQANFNSIGESWNAVDQYWADRLVEKVV
jgi:hypothetical protein